MPVKFILNAVRKTLRAIKGSETTEPSASARSDVAKANPAPPTHGPSLDPAPVRAEGAEPRPRGERTHGLRAGPGDRARSEEWRPREGAPARPAHAPDASDAPRPPREHRPRRDDRAPRDHGPREHGHRRDAGNRQGDGPRREGDRRPRPQGARFERPLAEHSRRPPSPGEIPAEGAAGPEGSHPRAEQAPRPPRPRREHPRSEHPRPDHSRPENTGEPHSPDAAAPSHDHGRDEPRRERRPRRDHHADAPAAELPPQTGPLVAPLAERPPHAWDPALFPVEPEEGKTRFHDLDLPVEILHAIADLGFKFATPIQAQILPEILKGRDGLGQAQTGTGKTAAFLCALFTRLLRNPPLTHRRPGLPRALILAPTRELAVQIGHEAEEIGKYTGMNSLAVFGGQDYERQQRALHTRIIDIVAATPGRLLDFKNSQDIDLSAVEVLVIDEADRMLDMGFIPDVRRIVRFTPPKEKRQTLFFSATFSDDILKLGDSWTTDPARIHIASTKPAAETVDQAIYIAADREKLAIIYHVLQHENPERVLIFVNRRDHADRLCEALGRVGVRSAILSGNVPQNRRMRTLEEFREGTLKVVVATDVAGRGLHIDGVSHVINYNLPEDPEDYVHRIGRTGRAGASGKSISFASEMDAFAIPGIEKYLQRTLTCTHPDDAWLKLPAELEAILQQSGHTGGRNGLGRSRGPGGGAGGGFRRGPGGRGPSRGGPRRR